MSDHQLVQECDVRAISHRTLLLKNSIGYVQPYRTHQGEHSRWDAGSDISGMEGRMGGNLDHRQMADKAYRKWLKKQKGSHNYDIVDFRKSYIAAGESRQFDTLLWSGLAVLLTGTVVSFVGLGEKGFRTSYLRLLGPILCGAGLAVVIFRIGICCCSTGKKKAVVAINVKEQLSKVVHVHHAVAVRNIQYRPGEGPSVIPFIQIDPSKLFNKDLERFELSFPNFTAGCESGMKSSVTAATDLSPEGSPLLSGENEPLIGFQSTDNTPVTQTTTAVIESEWISRMGRNEPVDTWTSSRNMQSELALSPLSLTTHDTTSLISSIHKS